MSVIVRDVPLQATQSYDAPRGLPRVRMTANALGVQMLAAVNGEGAYTANKHHKRRARKLSRKARAHFARARSSGWGGRGGRSRRGRGGYASRWSSYKKGRKASKKARKAYAKHHVKHDLKKFAKQMGVKYKDLKGQLRGKGGSGGVSSPYNASYCAPGKASQRAGGQCATGTATSLSPNGRRRFRRSSSWKGYAMSTKKRRSRKSSRRGRRGAKRGRARASKRSGRGRRFRRNGDEDDIDEMLANMTPNRRGGWKKRGRGSKKRWGKGGRGSGGYAKRMLKQLGLEDTFASSGFDDPVAAIMAREFESKLAGDPVKLAIAHQMLAKQFWPRQSGYSRGKIPIRVVLDPITGRERTIKVPWHGKVRTAYGPYKRRKGKGGAYSYEYKKGKHIPDWALAGAFSQSDFDTGSDPKVSERARNIFNARLDAANKIIERADKLQALSGTVREHGSRYTPNAHRRSKKMSSRRRRGRRSAAGRKRNKRGQFVSTKRRGRKSRKSSSRRGRKSSKRGRLSSKRRGRSSKRRGRSSKRRGRSSKRRGGRSSKRRGCRGRRMRANELVSGIKAAFSQMLKPLAGFSAHKILRGMLFNAGVLSMVPPEYALLASSVLTGIVLMVGAEAALGEATGTELSIGIAVSVAQDALNQVLVAMGQKPMLAGPGVGYQRTTRWQRGAGEYELRGLGRMGEYELRGLGRMPVIQAAAGYGEYELRGFDGSPTFDGLRPEDSDKALDLVDRASMDDLWVSPERQAGEYVNTQLRPELPMFTADSLRNEGVPGRWQGVPERDIWIPDDPADRVQSGGIFSDGNT